MNIKNIEVLLASILVVAVFISIIAVIVILGRADKYKIKNKNKTVKSKKEDYPEFDSEGFLTFLSMFGAPDLLFPYVFHFCMSKGSTNAQTITEGVYCAYIEMLTCGAFHDRYGHLSEDGKRLWYGLKDYMEGLHRDYITAQNVCHEIYKMIEETGPFRPYKIPKENKSKYDLILEGIRSCHYSFYVYND